MTGRAHLDLIVYPHRSLSRRHFKRLMWVIGGITGLAALRFLFVGAWPVVLFVAADIFAIWLAFTISYRRARLTETVRLTDTDLLVERRYPNGRRESWRLEPYWAKVKLLEDERGGTELTITTHQQTVSLGAYLNPAERRDLAAEIREALEAWQRR